MLTIDYNEYVTRYQADEAAVIPQRLFSAYLTKAACFLESATMGQFCRVSDAERGKRCACEIAELYYKHFLRCGIAREDNDGYSVTYDGVSAEKEAGRIAALYLSGTGLLYRGIGS